MRELRDELDLLELRDDLELLADELDLRDEDDVARDELLGLLLERVEAPAEDRDEPLEDRVRVPDELRVVVPREDRVVVPDELRVDAPLEDLVRDPDELRVVVPLDERVLDPDELRVVVPLDVDPRVVDVRVELDEEPREYASPRVVRSVRPRYVDRPTAPRELAPLVARPVVVVEPRPDLVAAPEPDEELPLRTTFREDG